MSLAPQQLTQELLRDTAARRVAHFRPDLAARHDLSTTAGLLALQGELATPPESEDIAAVTVIRHFEAAQWAAEACAFAAGLAVDQAAAWQRSFTRTIFLAGDPERLRERARFCHVAADGSAGWLAPAPERAHRGVLRLLKRFDGGAALPLAAPVTVAVPAAQAALEPNRPPGRPPRRYTLHLATAGLTVTRCLIHVGHLIAEAVQDGLLEPGDRLAVAQVPRLTGLTAPFDALRVAPDSSNPERLQAVASLTKDIHDN